MSYNEFNKKAEEWGKVKFKPTLNTTPPSRISQNPFSKPQNFNRTNDKYLTVSKGDQFHDKFGQNRGKLQNIRREGKFQKDKERTRFNVTARCVKPGNATPWTKFKDELNNRQREEYHATQQANMDTAEGKHILKQREMNYRKQLMEQKLKEPIQWEDFREQDQNEDTKKIRFSKSKGAKHSENDKTMWRNKNNKFKENQTGNELRSGSVPNWKKRNNQKLSEEGQELERSGVERNDGKFSTNKKKEQRQQQGRQDGEENNVNAIKTKQKRKKQPEPESDQTFAATGKADITKNRKKRKHPKPETGEELNPEVAEQPKKKRSRKNHTPETSKAANTANKDIDGKNESELELKRIRLSKDEQYDPEYTKISKKSEANELSFHQKDNFRALLTKGIMTKYGTTLEQCLKNRKRQFERKNVNKVNK